MFYSDYTGPVPGDHLPVQSAQAGDGAHAQTHGVRLDPSCGALGPPSRTPRVFPVSPKIRTYS